MNNWPKFLPHPASWARAFALSSGFWLIVSLLPVAYYYSSYGLRAAYRLTYNNSGEGAIAFAWACQIPLFAFYHWGLTRVC
ncbi:hypothetical protein IQ270_15585 [Microcoleus sp. LEGE 07076]|uniref:hypothetical protein n=1 Tax=Microcoleus sp. LEGE 07076 TaxID=915322 RepID=UPI00187EBF90|nr:hypothetical protein [Microcoleus sp. LEGE 07076]MBE9186070.1 hypothetical protein [Microcoleus sp. LEGE 07076]